MNTPKNVSWNVKSHVTDKSKLLAVTAANLDVDVAVLQETRRGMGHEESAGNAYNLCCTKHDDTPNHGVGFLVLKGTKIEPPTAKLLTAITVIVPQHPMAER